ncbi:MAG: hypothetical protein EXQ69_06605 [Acidimicrobiia bacterium]|nr:hypothetical protein [Acidimicrobiia bacterium]
MDLRTICAVCSGFLLAVLWFDMMFDVQVRETKSDDLPTDALASISTYYARVTTGANPMNRLVLVVMASSVLAHGAVIFVGGLPLWKSVIPFVFTVGVVGLAVSHTVGNAERLGRQTDDATQLSSLARSVFRDHKVCFAAISTVLVISLIPA